MAQDRKAREEAAAHHRALTRAAERIYADPDLRKLVIFLYEVSGMAQDPFTTNALTTAHAAGKMSVMRDFLALLETLTPNITSEIVKEINDAARASNTDSADAGNFGFEQYHTDDADDS